MLMRKIKSKRNDVQDSESREGSFLRGKLKVKETLMLVSCAWGLDKDKHMY